MKPDVPADLLEIRDPEVDVAALMAEIRERIRQRRAALGADNRVFPSYDVTACPAEPEDIPVDSNLFHHLRLANEVYAHVETEPALVASPLSKMPLIGRIWERVRPALHTLILYYVNRAASNQVATNRHLVSALNQLTGIALAQQRQILALQQELAALRQRDGG